MSRVLKENLELARALSEAGAMDKITLRQVERLSSAARRKFTPRQIKALRAKSRLSQPLFADLLGVGKTTVAQWEQGLKQPSGPALRLLDIIARKGIETLA